MMIDDAVCRKWNAQARRGLRPRGLPGHPFSFGNLGLLFHGRSVAVGPFGCQWADERLENNGLSLRRLMWPGSDGSQ